MAVGGGMVAAVGYAMVINMMATVRFPASPCSWLCLCCWVNQLTLLLLLVKLLLVFALLFLHWVLKTAKQGGEAGDL